MKKNAMAVTALALALCLLLAGCGGQGTLPVSPDAPGETAQNGEAKEPPAEEPGGTRGGEAEQPQENDGPQNTEAENPQENAAARSAETKKAETKKWQAVTIDAAGFGIPKR